ncbi:urea transporter [Vaginella massiliensis]|uniref:urea transporter n=1 Tax=Vaginella massiliensis TaxID=1816680 RepID=UPI0037538A33
MAIIKNIYAQNNIQNKGFSFVKKLLVGNGQIMLQENATTGLLLLLGVFYSSVAMGFATILALVCATFTAILLRFDQADVNKGLYGFNAALVGVGTFVFLKPIFIAWAFLVLGSIATTFLQHFFMKRKIPVFTLPFVLVIWFIYYFSKNFFPNILSAPSLANAEAIDYFAFAVKGFGQVIFQDNLVAGILFFVAVFVSSPISAVYGLFGAVLSGMIASYFSFSAHDIALGLFSYNAVLCAITFAGKSKKDAFWVIVSVVVSLVVSVIVLQFGVIILTFPFVFAACVTTMCKMKSENSMV